jgi:hypothetical protein
MSEVQYSRKEQFVGISVILIISLIVQYLYNLYLQSKGMYVTFLEVVGILSIFMMVMSVMKAR